MPTLAASRAILFRYSNVVVLSFMATNESKADPLAAYTGYSFSDDQSYQVSLSLSSRLGWLEKLPQQGRPQVYLRVVPWTVYPKPRKIYSEFSGVLF